MVVSDVVYKASAAIALAAGVAIGYYFGRPRQVKNGFVLLVRIKLKPGLFCVEKKSDGGRVLDVGFVEDFCLDSCVTIPSSISECAPWFLRDS
jgi:hypothetical protein